MLIYLMPGNFGAQTVLMAFGQDTCAFVKKELGAENVEIVRAGDALILKVLMPDPKTKDPVDVFRTTERQWKRINEFLDGRSLTLIEVPEEASPVWPHPEVAR